MACAHSAGVHVQHSPGNQHGSYACERHCIGIAHLSSFFRQFPFIQALSFVPLDIDHIANALDREHRKMRLKSARSVHLVAVYIQL